MILIIPSLELSSGRCPYCIKGEPGTEAFYDELSRSPEKLCELFRRENAKTVMIIDRDSFYGSGYFDNKQTINLILQNLDIPVQLLYNYRNLEEIEHFLKIGVQRVVIGSYAYHNPGDIRTLIEKYTASRIIFYMHTSEKKLKDMENVDITDVYEYAEKIKSFGTKRMMLLDEEWAANGKPDFDYLRNFAARTGLKITVGSGASSPEVLWELQKYKQYGVDSAVIADALFNNNFPCQKIWRKIEAQLEL